jgi:hypothetical protein
VGHNITLEVKEYAVSKKDACLLHAAPIRQFTSNGHYIISQKTELCKSTIAHIFRIRQTLEKELESNKIYIYIYIYIYELFTDFKKAYDSVRSEVLYNIFIHFGVQIKLVWLIKTCLNETYS